MTPMVDIVMVILIFMAPRRSCGEEWFLRAAIPVEAVPGKAANSRRRSSCPRPGSTWCWM
jgi:biopolymer transport protein ExbD